MKRSRRPPKKATRQKAPVEAMKAAQAAVFDAATPPKGLAYQWAPASMVEEMQDAGWVLVPFERHRDHFPSRLKIKSGYLRGYIVYRKMALFQRDAELVAMRHEWNWRAARDMLEQHPVTTARIGSHGFPILSPSFMVSSDYPKLPDDAKPVTAEITIAFSIPLSWQQAALYLRLTPQEYARRRLAMDTATTLVHSHDSYPSVYEAVTLTATKES